MTRPIEKGDFVFSDGNLLKIVEIDRRKPEITAEVLTGESKRFLSKTLGEKFEPESAIITYRDGKWRAFYKGEYHDKIIFVESQLFQSFYKDWPERYKDLLPNINASQMLLSLCVPGSDYKICRDDDFWSLYLQNLPSAYDTNKRSPNETIREYLLSASIESQDRTYLEKAATMMVYDLEYGLSRLLTEAKSKLSGNIYSGILTKLKVYAKETPKISENVQKILRSKT